MLPDTIMAARRVSLDAQASAFARAKRHLPSFSVELRVHSV